MIYRKNKMDLREEKELKESSMVNAQFYPDYPLSGVINHFEGYLFSTKEKHYEEHTSFDEELIIVDGNHGYEEVSMEKLEDRKKACTRFNKLAKEQGLSISSKDYSCVMCDFLLNEEDWDDNLINQSYQEVKTYFLQWTSDNNRVAVMVQHFYQGQRVPHVHFLIQRAKRKNNEFQSYVIDKMNA